MNEWIKKDYALKNNEVPITCYNMMNLKDMLSENPDTKVIYCMILLK